MEIKKLISIFLIVVLMLSSCAQTKIINGVQYEPYGVINRKDEKKENIIYKKKSSSVVLSILFFELIIPPLFLLGFNLYEPVKEKESEKDTEKAE